MTLPTTGFPVLKQGKEPLLYTVWSAFSFLDSLFDKGLALATSMLYGAGNFFLPWGAWWQICLQPPPGEVLPIGVIRQCLVISVYLNGSCCWYSSPWCETPTGLWSRSRWWLADLHFSVLLVTIVGCSPTKPLFVTKKLRSLFRLRVMWFFPGGVQGC